MKKYISVLYICFFVAFFILPSLISPLIISSNDENLENRSLAERPDFSLETIEEYPSEYENYYNDNLPFRSELIKANALINWNIFKQSPVSKVIIGNDGWLFYDPPINDGDPIGQCTGLKLTEEELKVATENLLSTRDILKEQGKDFAIILCPNKESIYGSDYLPEYYNASSENTAGDQLVDYLQQYTDINIIYPKKAILNAIDTHPEYDFYYKLDTHWNNLGGYIATRELLDCFEITLPSFEELEVTSTIGRSGDLSSMTGLPEVFDEDLVYSLYGYSQNKVTSNNSIKNVETFTATNADERSVLIIRDSFANAMYPYINSQFSESNFIHIDNYSPDVLQECNPDIVILQVVERFLARCQSFKIQ